MPNTKQASKRVRQIDKRHLANRLVLGNLRSAVKNARAAVDSAAPNAAELVSLATKAIDRAVTKGTVKRKTGSRYISRLVTRRA